MKIICQNCSKEFEGNSDRKFCSKSCSASHSNKNRKDNTKKNLNISAGVIKNNQQKGIYPHTAVWNKTCVQCSKLFYTKRSEGIVCSKICQNKKCSADRTGKLKPILTYRGKPTKSSLLEMGLIEPKIRERKSKPKPIRTPKPCRITIEKSCLVCEAIFTTKTGKGERKTCSRDCQYHLLSGKIGHTTHPEHVCKDGKKIVLGSSWEKQIAVFLDENNIEWIRPKSLDYVDESGKSRKYFPDFYLPDYDIYLDPKNPMKIKVDQHKLDYFKDKIVLYYGSVKSIKEKLVDAAGYAPAQSR